MTSGDHNCREVTGRKSKSGAEVKYQRKFMDLKAVSNIKWLLRVVLCHSTAL